ncbi:MAG: hypothetical protein IIZ55_00980 [Firmicutes bacterium]|nr:hypothetical protein [Bacillota bacterium]
MEYKGINIMEADTDTASFVNSFVEVEKFLAMCRECRNYNTVWSCPPYDFNVLDRWASFRTIHLTACRYDTFEGESVPHAVAALAKMKEILTGYCEELAAKAPGSQVVSAGSCTICSEGCSRPLGLPCRHPDRMKHSIESLGGDVGAVMEHFFGLPVLWGVGDKPPAYLILCGGVLYV